MDEREVELQQRKREAWSHRTAAVYIPPESSWPPIQAIRRAHDRQFDRWMPHVTLLYPFAPRRDLPDLLPALQAACAAVQPFEATLASFHAFQHNANRSTVWLAPGPRASFTSLQAALQAAAPAYSHVSRYEDGFVPHLSVGQSGGPEEVAGLIARLGADWKSPVFRVEEICIIARKGNDPFEVVQRLPLGAPGA